MEGFLGEIRFFAGNFAPRSWAFCEGQLLPISQNSALFSILGTIYGGDGRTTFGLPDMRGRVAIHAGNGPGLSDRRLGAKGGTETNTVTTAQIPSHNHTGHLKASATAGTTDNPANMVPNTSNATNAQVPVYGSTNLVNMSSQMVSVGNNGGGQAMNNMMPWISFYYIIALQGTYPSRS